MTATIESVWEEVQRISEKIDRLPGLIEVNGNQVRIVSLDELSETLGLIMAGEFRSGNQHAPGDSFSGVRIGYPGFYYPDTSTASSDLYNIVGVDADALQFGLRASDGIAVFGAGAAEISAIGIDFTPAFGLGGTQIKYNSSDGHLRALIHMIDAFSGESPIYHTRVGAEESTSGLPVTNAIINQLITWHADTSLGDTYGIFLSLKDFASVTAGTDSDGSIEGVWGMRTENIGANSYNRLFQMNITTDTTSWNLELDVPLMLDAHAAADVSNPDNEMGKLWLDTDGEMRLTDSGGEDWYVTKSTSTGGNARTLFYRSWIDGVTDAGLESGNVIVPGSDTSVLAESGEIVLQSGYVYEVAMVQRSLAEVAGTIAHRILLLDTDAVTVGAIAGQLAFASTDLGGSLLGIFDSGTWVASSNYRFALGHFQSSTGDRTWLADSDINSNIRKSLLVTEKPRNYTVSTG